MTRWPTFACVLAISLASYGLSGPQLGTPDSAAEERLRKVVPEYIVHADNLLQALAEISARLELPMGIEWSDENGRGAKRVDARFHRKTVEAILDAIVSKQPSYKWELQRGVIHVYPEWAHDQHSFLRLRILNFTEKNAFVSFADRQLQRQVHRILVPPSAPQGYAGSVGSGLGDTRATFEFENATVEQILDAFLEAADFRVWVVTYAGRKDLTATGFRRTRSLYDKHIPDEYQPTWDLLLWGQDPVSGKMKPE